MTVNLILDPDNPVLTPAQRRGVLAQIREQLACYVDPAIAAHLQQELGDRCHSSAYDDLATAPQLADRLTLELQTLSGDRQLRVHYSPTPLPDLPPHHSPTAAELAAEQQRSAHRNFDINRVERLAGNVGYLQLYGFEPPEFVGDALAAAFTLLAHTQALILDLRHNRGGSPGTVALLCSYLLPPYPATHLNDVYWRPDESTRQWWTLPHLAGPRYLDRPLYLLTSSQTFSAAEECAYNLQVLKRATLVGEHTAGGSQPGQGYRLNPHFWMFIPVGRSTNPKTGSNWGSTGVVPDVKVPQELTLLTAHVMALNHLLDTVPQGTPLREVQAALGQVERELNSRRAELIHRLKRPNPEATLTEE